MSAMELSPIIGRIGFDTVPAVRGLNAVAEETKKWSLTVNNEVKKATKQTETTYKDMLRGIKGELGKSSALGQSLKLLAGGGVIAGLGLAAAQFEALTGKIADFAAKVRQGGMDWRDMSNELVGSLPIIGSVYHAFGNIAEAITGDKAAMAAATEQQKTMDLALEHHKQMLSDVKGMNLEYLDTLRQIEERWALMGKSGLRLQFQQINNETTGAIAGALSKRGSQAGLSKEEADRYKDLTRQMKELDASRPKMLNTEEMRRSLEERIGPSESPAARERLLQDAMVEQQNRLGDAMADWTKKKSTLQTELDALNQKMAASGDITGKTIGTHLADNIVRKFDAVRGKVVAGITEFKSRVEELGQKLRDARNAVRDEFFDNQKGLQKQFEQTGMDEWQKAADDIKRKRGEGIISKEEEQRALQLNQRMKEAADKLEQQKKVQGELASIETAREKFSKKSIELGDQYAKGLINKGQRDKLLEQAREDLFGKPRNPEAFAVGSAQAQRARYEAMREEQRRAQGAAGQKTPQDLAKQAVLEQQNTNKNLQRIIDKLPDKQSNTGNDVSDLQGVTA